MGTAQRLAAQSSQRLHVTKGRHRQDREPEEPRGHPYAEHGTAPHDSQLGNPLRLPKFAAVARLDAEMLAADALRRFGGL
jgi:hypothetical protein